MHMPEPWENPITAKCPTCGKYHEVPASRTFVPGTPRIYGDNHAIWAIPCPACEPAFTERLAARVGEDEPQPPSLDERKVAALERIATCLEELLRRQS